MSSHYLRVYTVLFLQNTYADTNYYFAVVNHSLLLPIFVEIFYLSKNLQQVKFYIIYDRA